MATLPKPDLNGQSMTASELLAIRGTPEFEIEYARQCEAVAQHDRKTGNSRVVEEFMDWDVPGWTYDAEL